MNGQAQRDLAISDTNGNLACNASEMAAPLLLFCPAHAKSAKVITEIQCSSVLAHD